MGQGQVFLNRMGGGWNFSYLVFSRFIIFTFRHYFILAKLCYAFEEKLYFSEWPFLKGHSKLSKNESENIL